MRTLRALSLDIVAGAAAGGLLAEHMTGTRMPAPWWVALLGAVWCVYTADHLLDSRRPEVDPEAPRHAFHRRHFGALSLLLGLVAGLGLAAAWALPSPLRLFGLGMGVAVLAYLASAQGHVLKDFPKEPPAGVLYAAGIWGGPLLTVSGLSPWLLFASGLQALAAVLNLAMIGIFESEADRRHGHRSLALRFGPPRTRQLIYGASAAGFAGAVGLAVLTSAAVGAILAIQISTPAALLIMDSWSQEHERYRIWGDAVFFLGALPAVLSL